MSLVEVNQAILAWSFLICDNKTVLTQYIKLTKLSTCKVCEQNYTNFCVLHIALNILYNLHVAAFFFNLSGHFIYRDNVFSFPPLTPLLVGPEVNI